MPIFRSLFIQTINTFSPSNKEGKTYMFQYLCTSLSAAPRVFTKLLKTVLGFLRQNGCRLIIHLDNMLMLYQDRGQLQQLTQLTCQLFESLGLTVNQKKSVLMPAQKLHRLSPVLRNNEAVDSPREIEENPIECPASAELRICVSEGNSKVCGQGYSYHESHPTGPVALQSPPTTNELCSPSNYIQVEISTKYETMVTLTPTSKRNLQWWVELKKAPLGAPL